MTGKTKCTILILALCMLACQPAEEPAEPVSTEADVEALRDMMRQIDAAINAGNLDGPMAFYADDAVQMPPNIPIFIGKEAIRSGLEEFLAANTVEQRSTVEDIRVSGDWAFLRLSYTMSITSKDGGDTTTEVGKWVLICQRQADGSWRIATEIWNTDAPSNGS